MGEELLLWLVALGVAIVLGAPTVLQMVYGGPRIEVDFTRDHQGNLFCDVYNRPVSNRFLVHLPVRREKACISVGFQIRTAENNGLILGTTIPSALINDQFAVLDKIDLPASNSPLSAMIVQISGIGAGVYNSNGVRISLPIAIYRMEMLVMAAEKNIHTQRNFVVTADPTKTYWADS